VLAAGCSKNEETLAEKIIGTWELQYLYQDKDNNPIDLSVAETYESVEFDYCSLTFGTDSVREYSGSDNNNYYYYAYFTYTIDDNCIYTNETTKNTVPKYNVPIYAALYYGTINGILYNLSNNKLIIGSRANYFIYYPGTPVDESCVHYAIYNRKQ
jgi:hypothetical protein